MTKVKNSMPEFLNDSFGDPYISAGEDIKEFMTGLEESDNENEENDLDEAAKEELEQIKSALEEEDGSSKIYSQTEIQGPSAQPNLETNLESPPVKKKRRGRPPGKPKKDTESNGVLLEENMVSSSSQEPRVASIAIQTPSKLLKGLVAETSKISKEELRQLKEKVIFKIFL